MNDFEANQIKKAEKELTLKDDLVFKFFFAKKGNEKYLKSFLEAILNIKIKNIEIMQEAELYKLTIDQKNGRLDIKATIDNEKIINIEMQVANEHNIKERSTYYGSRLIAEQLENGYKYNELKPVILINILDFNIFTIPEYHSETVTVLKEHRDYEVITDVKYHFIELPKFRKSNPELMSLLECWLKFLDKRKGEVISMDKRKPKIIEEAEKELEEILSNKEFKELYEYRLSARLEENSRLDNARNKGLEEGRIIGENDKKKEIAINLLHEGVDISIIEKVTGISKKEIEKLIVEEGI